VLAGRVAETLGPWSLGGWMGGQRTLVPPHRFLEVAAHLGVVPPGTVRRHYVGILGRSVRF